MSATGECGADDHDREECLTRLGVGGSYDDWAKKDLIQRAREIGIMGRSSMSKAQLLSALRDH